MLRRHGSSGPKHTETPTGDINWENKGDPCVGTSVGGDMTSSDEEAGGLRRSVSSATFSATDQQSSSMDDDDHPLRTREDSLGPSFESAIDEEEESGSDQHEEAAPLTETQQQNNSQRHFPHVDVNQSMKLTAAIQGEDWEGLCGLLKGIGLSPATYCGPSGNLLHIVTLFGPVSFVERLLAAGVNINEQNGDGDTVLHTAARTGRATFIDVLLTASDLDDTITNEAGCTAHQVAKNRQIATAIEYSRSLYVNRKTKEMHSLVAQGNAAGLRRLFEVHRNRVLLNVDAPDGHGDTMLHIAAKMDDAAMVRCCLDLGVDAFLKNKKGRMALELAKDDEVRAALKEAPMKEPAEGIPSSRTRLEAYLNKWTNYAEGYKKRWFVLEEGVLSYYKNQAEYPVSCRGSINMQFAKVHRHPTDKLRFEVTSLTNAHTKIHLRAETVSEAGRWNLALNQACVSSLTASESELKLTGEPLALALSTTEKYSDQVQKALGALSELEILLQDCLNTASDADLRPLTVEGTGDLLFYIREALLAAEDQERQWRRRWEAERAHRRVLEDSFQKLAVENSRIEKYQRIRAMEEVKGRSIMVLKDGESCEAVDEFYDALEAEASAMPEEEPSVRRLVKSDTGFVARDLAGYPAQRRSTLPCDSTGMKPVSLWSILKNAIGKDLSRIPVPVNYSEPVSMLQRLCEEMEYSELLDIAWGTADPLLRVQYVAAFAASSYASTDGRTTKPFNPLLGETFEYVSQERGFRYVAEQVSHHPPISACHCESARYEMWAEVNVSSKFWGKSMELTPEGRTHLVLKGVGPGGADEHYSWKKVKTAVNNIVVGKLWIDHYGEMKVLCHQTGVACTLTFKATGWRTVEPKRIEGSVTDGGGAAVYELAGFWNSRLTSTHLETGEQTELWRKRALPPAAATMYKFTAFTMTLNELSGPLLPFLAPTDSRLRPDQRAMEQGDFEAANTLKVQLEEKQRSTRKALELQGLKVAGPRWFERGPDADSGDECWLFNGAYWERRPKGEWDNVPAIFLQDPKAAH